jgi:pyruvate/2-oxoglutarate dehydrogenase complex dihydrolipoamide dehydrogenase (E3) component
MEPTFDIVVIGAGPAGEAAVHKARALGATVAVVDRRWFGGSCPHIGCLPSKALLHGAAEHRANAAAYAWPRASAHRDFMVNRPAGAAEPDDRSHVRSLEGAGATVYRGDARIVGRGRVAVSHDGARHEVRGESVIVAVGSHSRRIAIPGIDAIEVWTNEQATLARELPRSLLVLGGGPTGCELAQVYARFGVPSTIVQSGPRLAPTDHPRNSEAVRAALEADGVTVRTGVRAVAAERVPGRTAPISWTSTTTRPRRVMCCWRRSGARSRSTTSAWSTTASTRAGARRPTRGMVACGSPTVCSRLETRPGRNCTRTRRTTRASWPPAWPSARP